MKKQVEKILGELDPDKTKCKICEKYCDISTSISVFSEYTRGLYVCHDCDRSTYEGSRG